MNSSNFYVYVHSRLKNGEPFYIGKGHGQRAYTHKSRSQHWKNIVAKDSGFDVSFISENMDEKLAFLVEIDTIDKYRRSGVKLINLTNGGDGVSGYRNPNGAHNKGKPCSEEMKARISATNKAKGILPPIGWNKGKKTPQDVIEKRRTGMIAAWAKAKADGSRVVSAAVRSKMRAAKLGHVKSDETRRLMSLAAKVRASSPVERARLSAIMKERWRRRKEMAASNG